MASDSPPLPSSPPPSRRDGDEIQINVDDSCACARASMRARARARARAVRVRVRVDTGVCARARASMCAGARVCGLPHKNGVGTLFPDLSLSNPPCFIESCKAQGGLLRMASFSKERVPSTFFTV